MSDLQQQTIPDDIMTTCAHLSIMGRLAYFVMCIETYLVHVHPDRDWRLLAKGIWLYSSMPLAWWLLLYEELKPDTVLHLDEESLNKHYRWRVQKYFTWDEYQSIVRQYSGITDGHPDDPDDVLSAILRVPFDLVSILADDYDDPLPSFIEIRVRRMLDESLHQISKLLQILFSNHIEFPDVHQLDFLTIKDDKVWGERFDGPSLSILLPKETVS